MNELVRFNSNKHHIDCRSKNIVLVGLVPTYKYARVFIKDNNVMLHTSDLKTTSSVSICKARTGKKKWVYLPQIVQYLEIDTPVNFELRLVEKGDNYYFYKLVF